MKPSSKLSRGFTLIELLTVIAIIGVLAALLFPAIKGALVKAEVSKARSAITGLQTAFQQYYAEYGKWPIADAKPNHTYIVDSTFVDLLQGMDKSANTIPPAPAPQGLAEPPFIGPPYASWVGAATFQGNPRQTHFLDFKAADLDGSRYFVDPWKQPYKCRFDVSYGNQVANPFTGGGAALLAGVNAGFVIWSSGPDNQYDNTGDTPSPSAANKDNVKSW